LKYFRGPYRPQTLDSRLQTNSFMKIDKKLFVLVILTLVIKLLLCAFAAVHAPQGKILVDSHDYLATAQTLAKTGTFGRTLADGSVDPEFFRTPGYPLFLAVFHHLLHWSLDGVIVLQVLLSVAAALICARAAALIDPRLEILTAAILLFDPTITVYSLLVLTESLFLFLMALFLYFFVDYFRTRQIRWVIAAAVTLAAAVYVRPIGLYLGVLVACFIAGANWKTSLKRGLIHALVFITIVYGAIGAWYVRNHQQGGGWRFSSITGVISSSKGLWGSYERRTDRRSAGLDPATYYLSAASRGVMTLLTRPGSMKYFQSDLLKKAGKIVGYPFTVLMMIGFLRGLSRALRVEALAFTALVALYFIGASVGGAIWQEAPRFRVAMMPFLAVISAYGWLILWAFQKEKRGKL